MKPPERKVQVTLRMRRKAHKRAFDLGRRLNRPTAVVIADAAEQILLPHADETAEALINKHGKLIQNRLTGMQQTIESELALVREMLGIAVRIWLNHTPPLPESERDAAYANGRATFTRYVEHVARNIAEGICILDEHRGSNDVLQVATDANEIG